MCVCVCGVCVCVGVCTGVQYFSQGKTVISCGFNTAVLHQASKPEHAGVILWDTNSWKQITTLFAHSLTVTQIAFSRNGQRLLTVSRDRTWAVFNRHSEGEITQSHHICIATNTISIILLTKLLRINLQNLPAIPDFVEFQSPRIFQTLGARVVLVAILFLNLLTYV